MNSNPLLRRLPNSNLVWRRRERQENCNPKLSWGLDLELKQLTINRLRTYLLSVREKAILLLPYTAQTTMGIFLTTRNYALRKNYNLLLCTRNDEPYDSFEGIERDSELVAQITSTNYYEC